MTDQLPGFDLPDFDLPDFDRYDLAAAVERLPAEALDDLPFGAIRLDAAGEVAVFSGSEKRLSGYGDRPALGRHFFTQIAPCMNTPQFRGRIEQALAAGDADIEFGWIGDFGSAERETAGARAAGDRGRLLDLHPARGRLTGLSARLV